MRLLLFPCLAVALAAAPSAQALDRAKKQDLIVQCAACHGADGVARDAETPDLAGQHDVYIYRQLRAFRSGARPHKEMRYMGRHMTDEEMRAIASYYSGLPKQ